MNDNSTNNVMTWDQIKGSDQSKLLVYYMGVFTIHMQFMCSYVCIHILKSIDASVFWALMNRAFYDNINAM